VTNDFSQLTVTSWYPESCYRSIKFSLSPALAIVGALLNLIGVTFNPRQVRRMDLTIMATSAVAPTTTDLAVKSENVIYERYTKLVMSDTEPTKVNEVKTAVLSNPKPEEQQKLVAEGYILEFTQTVRVDKAGTEAGEAEIVKDADERVIIWNRGLQSKLNQKLNSLFKESNEDGSATFQSTEEIYDPSDLLNEATQRKSLSPIEKAMKGLEKSGISAEMLQAAIAALQSAQAGS
jgi:hypothetical protein